MDHLRSILKTQSENDRREIIGQNEMEKYLSGIKWMIFFFFFWETIKWMNWGWKNKENEFEKSNVTEKRGEGKWLLIKKLWRELNNY